LIYRYHLYVNADYPLARAENSWPPILFPCRTRKQKGFQSFFGALKSINQRLLRILPGSVGIFRTTTG
jgi:hypothetical protein